MSTKREAMTSTVLRFICDDCGTVLRVNPNPDLPGFGAARLAAGKGWTFTRLDRCKDCTRHAQGKTSRKR